MQGLTNKRQEPEIDAGDQLTQNELIDGLTAQSKYINPRFFYDETGSQLFQDITRLPEYYPTRTELALLTRYKDEIADVVGQEQVLIEPGAGSCSKVRQLLPTLNPVCYVPIDISREFLFQAADQLQLEFPATKVLPLVDDMGAKIQLASEYQHLPRTIFYPGSTIGNYQPEEAVAFLQHVHDVIGKDGGLLIGVDLHKDSGVLHDAYNDAQGITARFNRNILIHTNRLLGTQIDAALFEHVAFYNESARRIEMHLESTVEQSISIANRVIRIAAGERILTEYSYKYSLQGFADLAKRAGLTSVRNWVDERGLFSLQYYHVG